MLLAQLIKADVRSDICVEFENNAAVLKPFCTPLNDGLVEFEVRDAVN